MRHPSGTGIPEAQGFASKSLCMPFMLSVLLLLCVGAAGLAGSRTGRVPPTPTASEKAAPTAADWPYAARIATPYDYPSEQWTSWEDAVDQAVADGATVILDWSCISDEWQCLFEPDLSESIEDIRSRAEYLHQHHPGTRYIIYVSPLEYVTPDVDQDRDGQVDPGKEDLSLALQHPEWIQMGISGTLAVFYGSDPGMPFWVCPTCEDVWLTPANPDYRERVLEQARQLAQSGIDGIWFDVPFLRHTFGEAWYDQWPDVSPDARDLFHQQTGYSLPQPPFAPDWNDLNWLAFVEWRYRLIRDFVSDYYEAVREANPQVRLIIESSVGFNPFATQTAASPLDIPAVSDLTAHERGGTRRPVQYYRWLHFLAELLAWRHIDIAHGEPSWLLSYVEAGHPDTVDVARLHAATVLLMGFGYYTSGNETMSGMPDPDFRRELFGWVAERESDLYPGGMRPYANVAVVFSQRTLDYRSRGSWEQGAYSDGFYGMLMMLLESHIPFEVISERDTDRLGEFEAVILPAFEAMDDAFAQAIRDYVRDGGVLIATGETSLYDEWGRRQGDFALADLFGVSADEAGWGQVYVNDYGNGRVVFSRTPYEQEYFWAAQPWDESTSYPDQAEAQRQAFLQEVWSRAGVMPLLDTYAPRTVMLIPWRRGALGVDVRVLNYTGVEYGNVVPITQTISVTVALGTGVKSSRWLDFLGGWTETPLFSGTGDSPGAVLRVSWGGIWRIDTLVSEVYLPLVLKRFM